MQTTLRIQDELYRAAKAEAAREGITLTRYLESAIALRLQKKDTRSPSAPYSFPVFHPEKPLELTSLELKHRAQELELEHDLKKLSLHPTKK
jgi:hypothetical protein